MSVSHTEYIEPVTSTMISLVLLLVTFEILQENFSFLVSEDMGSDNKTGIHNTFVYCVKASVYKGLQG